MTHVNLPAIAIGDTTIHQHNGLYSLNDLHKASGGEAKHRPGYFLANEQSKSLIAEIVKAGIPAFESRRGVRGSTYACRELVVAYAAWISAEFHLKVIRVFLDTAMAQPQYALTQGVDQDVVDEIIRVTTGNLMHFMKAQRKYPLWGDVIDALTDKNTTITFPELTDLTHACLNRLQRSVNSEAYECLRARAQRQGVSTAEALGLSA